MSNNPAFWSSVGFWVLMAGLIGDFAVLFVPSGKVEKRLAAVFTILIAIGVAVEHMADARRFAARILTSEQQQHLAQKLSRFAGTPFVLAVNPDSESITFMSIVNGVLIRGGWKWEPAEHDKTTGLIITVGDLKAREWATSGITIGFREEGRASLLMPADTLASAFEGEGLTVKTGVIPPTISNNPDAVYVVIGSK